MSTTVTQYNVRKPNGSLLMGDWTESMEQVKMARDSVLNMLSMGGAEELHSKVEVVSRSVEQEIGTVTVVDPEALVNVESAPAPSPLLS